MVFLLQVVDAVEAGVDGVELRRFEVDAVKMAVHLLSNVLQFDVCGVHALGQFGGSRKHVADALQGVHGAAQQLHGSRLVARQRIVGLVESALDVLSVSHRLALLLQLLLFAVGEACFAELVVLEFQEVGVLAVLLNVVL